MILLSKSCSEGEAAEGGASTAAPSLALFNRRQAGVGPTSGRQTDRASLSVSVSVEQQNSRLEPWYSYTHWFPMASSHVMKPGPEPVPRMQPAMMMFSSKYWARRGLSLDSAMFHQQQQRHTGGQMVRTSTHLHPPPPPSPQHVLTVLRVLSVALVATYSRKSTD